MKKEYLFIIAVLFISGCAHKQKMDTVLINTLPPSLGVEVSPPSDQYINDMLEITVKVKNSTKNEYNHILYRFKWFDQSNYEVGQNLSIWKPLFLEARDTKQLTSLAPSPKAEQFKFYIKEGAVDAHMKRVDPNSLQGADVCYGPEELHIFVEAMVSSMLKEKLFDGKPIIDIRGIKNETDEDIDTEAISDGVQTAIIKSKRARFIDSSMRASINKELEYQNRSKYIDKKSSKKIGKQIAPNYFLDGTIITIKKRVDKKLDYFYKITLQLHNVEKATIDWADQKEVRKLGEKR